MNAAQAWYKPRALRRYAARVLTILWQLTCPTLVQTIRARSRITPVDPDASLQRWEKRLQAADEPERSTLVESLTTAYQTALGRQAGLESKGVGVLQVAAIVAAILILGMSSTSNMAVKSLAAVGLAYLALSVYAAARVLMPRPRYLLTSAKVAVSATTGQAEIGQAADMTVPLGIETNNWIAASLYDLGRAGVAAAAMATLIYLL